MYKKILEKIKGKNIAILGFGKEGISTYQFIRRHLKEQKVTIVDKNPSLKENSLFEEDKNVFFELGDTYLDHLEKFDLIIKSPGVRLKEKDRSKISSKITSQIGFILEDTDLFSIGITGSKGKSTTTSLLYHILKDQGYDAYLLGNIGLPPLDYIENMKKDSILVIEMAALQLEFIKKSPHIGIILNLFEEHLDFFGTKENYYQAKLNMLEYQNTNDYGFYVFDNPTLKEYILKKSYPGKLTPVYFSKPLECPFEKAILCDEKFIYIKTGNKLEKVYDCNKERTLLGRHNLENIMVCFGVADLFHLDNEKVISSITTFQTLEHRMEKVGTYDDIIYYNDAIATIPEATIHAINALGKVNTLIFGGFDRGIDYNNFITYLNNCSVENFICMPDTGYKIGKELSKEKKVYFCENLKDAVTLSKKITKKNHICLLSPAASSYNQFKNFEEKGKLYKEYIREEI